MENYITYVNLGIFVLVGLALCWGFNIVYTALTNARKEQERSREPFVRIDASMNDIRSKCEISTNELRSRVETLERKLKEHDRDLDDIHAGQSALCRGVQALLDHELHNGNEDEMKAASDSIGKWLRTR